MVDQMSKRKYRIGDGSKERIGRCRFRRVGGHRVWQTVESCVVCKRNNRKWDAALLLRSRRKTCKHGKENIVRSGHSRDRWICCGAPVTPSKREKVCLGFTAVGSRPFVSPTVFVHFVPEQIRLSPLPDLFRHEMFVQPQST